MHIYLPARLSDVVSSQVSLIWQPDVAHSGWLNRLAMSKSRDYNLPSDPFTRAGWTGRTTWQNPKELTHLVGHSHGPVVGQAESRGGIQRW